MAEDPIQAMSEGERMKTIDLDKITSEPKSGHTSKGDQPKWQVRGKWYKADHMGCEALAEILVSRLLAKSNVRDFVDYNPVLIRCHDRNLAGCVSTNFRDKNEMLIPLERLHRAYRGGKGLAAELAALPSVRERIQYTVDFIEKTARLTGVGAYLTTVLELDAFFLNEDRHTNNLAVVRNEQTQKFRLCPVFDNGLGLLSDLNDYPPGADIYTCIDKVHAKPFSASFDEQVEAANELYGSFLKFSFDRHDVSEILKTMEGLYSDNLLRRAERVVFEQMRKYSIYF